MTSSDETGMHQTILVYAGWAQWCDRIRERLNRLDQTYITDIRISNDCDDLRVEALVWGSDKEDAHEWLAYYVDRVMWRKS